jgi:uncharacterized YigZ family protein
MYALLSSEPYTLIIKGSRFLGELLNATSTSEAKEVVAAQRLKYADATHVVHAMAAGPTAAILGCSDDGEPAGTAGRPVLEVLKGSQLTNVVLTVTRWFGGTKLGTGGLVHAYSDCAKGVLENAKIREIIAMRALAFTVPYPLIESAQRVFAEYEFIIAVGNYDANGYAVQGELPASHAEDFMRRLADISRGKIIVESRTDG